jgi:DNA (cytosine-5)-methyltransferase 1
MLHHFATKEGVFSGMFKPMDSNSEDAASCIPAVYGKMPITNTYIKIKSATAKGYEEATIGDSINFSVPNSETRRGRVGKGVAQTLDTACNQGTIVGGKWNDFKNQLGDKKGFEPISDGCSPTLLARARNDGSGMDAVSDGYKIRRLTPRECFRLMDFPDSFTWPVSDSQAYKQAGNSIVVNVLYKILKQLPL